LPLVVRIVEPARIGALAGSLDLDEADKSVGDRDRVIRAGVKMREARLADQMDAPRREAGDLGQSLHQRFERPAQLILRCAADCDGGQLRLRARPEGGHRDRDRSVRQ